MSIIRTKKDQKYFLASNALFNDKNLSWEAKGVMGYLLSKPDGWQCHNYDLVNQGPAGKHIIQRVLKELKEAGYIHRFQESNGAKIEWVTEIYETPELNTISRNTDIPQAEKPIVGNSAGRESGDIVSTDSNQYLPTENTDINDSVKKSSNPVSQIVGIFKEEADKKQILNTLAAQIAQITTTDIDTVGQKTRFALKAFTLSLSKKSDINTILPKFLPWWSANDWRGQKGQAPTLWTMREVWGQFEAAQAISTNGTANTGPVLTEAEKAHLAELTAQFSPK